MSDPVCEEMRCTCFLRLFITPMIFDSNLYSSLDAIFFSLFFLGPGVFSHGVEAKLIMLITHINYKKTLIKQRCVLDVNVSCRDDVKHATIHEESLRPTTCVNIKVPRARLLNVCQHKSPTCAFD